MRIEQFICDAHQLTKYLQTRFGKEKIYLLGHSWGAKLGILLAEEYPEDYYAYIAVSQPVDTKMSNEVAYGWLKEQAEDKKNKKVYPCICAITKVRNNDLLETYIMT